MLSIQLIHIAFQDKRIERNYGYSFRGFPAQACRWYGNLGPRITAIPILSTDGMIELGIYRGTVEQQFLDFVSTKLVPLLQPFNGINPHLVVIMATYYSVEFLCKTPFVVIQFPLLEPCHSTLKWMIFGKTIEHTAWVPLRKMEIHVLYKRILNVTNTQLIVNINALSR